MARQVIVDILAKTQGFGQGVDKATSKLNQFSQKAVRIGDSLTRKLTLPIVGVGIAAFKMGSDLIESIGAAEKTFGKDSQSIIKWAKNLDSAFGLTNREALDMVSQFRRVTQNSKLTNEQMILLAERAADVGSQYNFAAKEVGERFRSALTGSTEVVEVFGVNIKQGSQGMTDYAASIGKSVNELTEAEKQQGFFNVIMAETIQTQNDAINTQGTSAGSLRTFKTEVGRAAEELGVKLIPAGQGLIEKLRGMVDWFTNLSPKMQTIIIQIAGITAVLGPLISTVGRLGQALVFVATNPAVLIIAAIAAIGVAIFLLERDTNVFGRRIGRAWTDLKISIARDINDIIGEINFLIRAFNNVLAIADIIPGLGDIRIPQVPTVNVPQQPTGVVKGSKRPLQVGGIVPGVPGQPQLVLAHGGERISRASDSRGTQRPILVVLTLDGRTVAEATVDPMRRMILDTGRRNVTTGFQ